MVMLTAGLVAQESKPTSAPRLRNVVISRSDVFSEPEAEHNLLYAIANWLHAVTKDAVLRREIWLRPGDAVGPDQVAEVERNLRATPWLGAVEASLEPVNPDAADLMIRTRDRLTLGASAGLAHVGGVTKYSATLSEANLFGSGKQVALAVRQTQTDKEALLQWIDPQFLDSWHRLSLEGGETEDGPFARFGLTRPLKHRDDDVTYGIEGRYDELGHNYYSQGEEVESLPENGKRSRLYYSRAFGSRETRETLGADLRWRRSDYSAPTGSEPTLAPQPPDVEEVLCGPVFGIDWAPRYDKRVGLDALDYVEDLKLGIEGSIRLAVAVRDEEGRGAVTEPVFAPRIAGALSPWDGRYLTVALESESRWSGGDAVGWRGSVALHAFDCTLPRQTLAASFAYDAAFEHEDAAVYLSLGEDNGLRGYPAREFVGSRVAKLNLEDRISTGLSIWSIQVGAVAFCDVGWVHGDHDDLRMSDSIASVGLGLRFGSSHLFGRRVYRLDYAIPLDEVNGQDYSPSLSFSVGQVFGFFGNRAELANL